MNASQIHYLIAVLPNRVQAEEAYTALEKEGIPLKNLAILGKGYKSADEFGLINPQQQARKQASVMALWLVPFGFASGYVFSLITGLNTFAWAGVQGNHLIGGVLGAIAGSMGSIVVGGGTAIAFGSGDALPYRNRLDAGKYLVVVKGTKKMQTQGTRILSPFNPENLQGYVQSE